MLLLQPACVQFQATVERLIVFGLWLTCLIGALTQFHLQIFGTKLSHPLQSKNFALLGADLSIL